MDGFARMRPSGNSLVRLRLVAGTCEALLSIVNVKVEVCPALISFGVNKIEKAGGGLTERVEVVVPLSPRVDKSFPLVRARFPVVCPTTSTVTVQTSPPAIVPLEKVKVFPSAGAAMSPPQVEVALGAAARAMPSGRVAEKVTSVASAWLPWLSMEKVSVLVSFTEILEGENELENARGTATTPRVSFAGNPSRVLPPTTVEMRLVLLS